MPPRTEPRSENTPRICGPACFIRINRLHSLLSANRSVNTEALARDLEVSSRTIKRDIDIMRDHFGAPVEWDASRKTHRYARPWNLPLAAAPRISADEALALVLASRAFAAWRGSPLGRVLAAALEKMRPMLGDKLSLSPGEIGNIIYEPLTPGDGETEAERHHLLRLLDAIRSRRVLRISYQKPGEHSPNEREIHPLHLAIFEQRWLLVAYDRRRRDFRKFLLGRIISIHETDTSFDAPPDFDASAYFAGSFGLFTGEKLFTVRIRFDAFAARFIRERRWHPSQTLRELTGGEFEARMRLNNLIDVRRWILGWGRHAVALAPVALVSAVRTETLDTLAHYAPRLHVPARVAKNRKKPRQ